MPLCYLSQDFLTQLLKSKPSKTIHYYDEEMVGFYLEYRPSGNGTWYFRYSKGGNKMRHFRMGGTKNIDAQRARARAYKVFALLCDGGDPQQEQLFKHKKTTVRTFVLERYLPHAKLKKRSWHLDIRILEKYFFSDFGERTLHNIKKLEIISWQNSLAEMGLKACSCNRILSVIKGIFNCAVRWGILDIAQNPCYNIRPLPENTPHTRYLNKQEAQAVLTMLKSMPQNRSALALQLLLYTGARKSEILTARWEHVHIETRILTIPLSKSGKARYIPLSDGALEVIQSLLQLISPSQRSSPWLFPAANPAMHICSVYYTWNKIRQALGLYDVRIHDLRHSFASLLVNAGRSLYEVQKILGHSNPKVTMRYAHLAQSSLVDAANQMEQSLR